jgi:hypothetical protein
MNFSVGPAFPNYSGSIGGNGNITVRGGPVDPVEIPVEPAAAAAGGPCQLGTLLVDEVNSTDQFTRYKLLSGFLTGGGGTQLIEVDNLRAIIGDFVWLAIGWTAEGGDSTIFPGGTMGTVTISKGSSIPSDTIPELGSLAGTAHIVLGGWISNDADPPLPTWVNQGCGSIQIFFCAGGFFFARNNLIT